MTFQLPEHLERSVLKAVNSGKFASLDDAMAAAARLLLETLQQGQPEAKTMAASEDGFLRQLVELGLMSQLPDTQADSEDSDDQLVNIEGEPLSETIIRERR